MIFCTLLTICVCEREKGSIAKITDAGPRWKLFKLEKFWTRLSVRRIV